MKALNGHARLTEPRVRPHQQQQQHRQPCFPSSRYAAESKTAFEQAAARAAAAVVALALQGSLSVGATQALEQQTQHLCPTQPDVVLHHHQQQQQQQRQPQRWLVPGLIQPLAELAGFFDNADASDPFTLYGTNFKKYEIEVMQGEKVVSRSRGFTVDTCVSGKTASEETPMFNGLSTGAKVEAGDDLLCQRATGSDLKGVCKQSCGSACEAALTAYESRLQAETGLSLSVKERQRVLKNCRHSCSYECTKSGKAHDFVVPSRR